MTVSLSYLYPGLPVSLTHYLVQRGCSSMAPSPAGTSGSVRQLRAGALAHTPRGGTGALTLIYTPFPEDFAPHLANQRWMLPKHRRAPAKFWPTTGNFHCFKLLQWATRCNKQLNTDWFVPKQLCFIDRNWKVRATNHIFNIIKASTLHLINIDTLKIKKYPAPCQAYNVKTVKNVKAPAHN